jgi:hypothetical protein
VLVLKRVTMVLAAQIIAIVIERMIPYGVRELSTS